MKWVPHKYQLEAIKFMVSRACAALFLDPGLGKTAITLGAFATLKQKRIVNKMLVVAPLRPAQSVWPAEGVKWDEFHKLRVNLLWGPRKDEALALALKGGSDVDVINYDGLPWLFNQRLRRGPRDPWPWEMLVCDECFPAGTKISTEKGEVDIEAIQPGDFVQTSDGLRRVLETGTRKASKLVCLRLSDGGNLTCTPEHPVFTEVGWVPAKLCQGRRVLREADLSRLWGEVSGECGVYSPGVLTKDLFSILRSETNVGRDAVGAPAGLLREDRSAVRWEASMEQGEALARSAPEEGLGAGQASGPHFQGARWEWEDLTVRGTGVKGFAERVGVELRGRVGAEAARLSHLLQARLCAPREEDRTRSRWGVPPADPSPRVGSQKGGEAAGTWVDRVEDLERPSTRVYNLRIEGCPHFFAENVLVHNSTRMKHVRTQRFRTLKPYLPMFARRYILTGTPAPNGLTDLFGQIYLLDLGYSLGQYITHFRSTYFFNPDGQGWSWVPLPGAEKSIYEKLKPLALRMDARDLLELPPLIENVVRVDLPEKARKHYQQMEDVLMTELEGEAVLAANASVAWGKCRQIANGGMFVDGEKWSHIHEEKVDAVEEIIEELGGKPCLVAYEYQHDLDRLRKRLGAGVPHIGGGVTASRFREIEASWNAGKIPVLLAQPQSVAHGLNLQGTAATVVFHSMTPDLEVDEQFIRRVWRQGQKERVVVHRIVARNTVDEALLKMLAKKDHTQKALLGALKGYLTGRRSS